jgi:hypothetical protein
MTAQPALHGLENTPENQAQFGGYGQGPTETETRKAIAEIEQRRQLVGGMRTLKQLAISLAISIDKGNNKGRAIANEAAQLFEMMQQLDPADADETTPDQYPPELKALLDAFESAPRLDPAPQGNAA